MKAPHISLSLTILVFAAFAGPVPEAFSSPLPSGLPQASSSNSLPAAGSNRPANVPDGYVITPLGYFHPSCVQSLSKGERLMADGRVLHSDGSMEETAEVCSHPHYLANGMPSKTKTNGAQKNGANTPSAINGWVENANVTTGSANRSYGGMIATWIVPARPLADDGQVLYYFPGFEDINSSQTSILQRR